MKTTLLYINMFLVLATVAFTACVPSTRNKQNQQTPKNVKLHCQYAMYCSGEILDFADIEITYSDSNGKLVTDTITSERKEEESQSLVEWHIDLGINTVPARLFMSSRYLPKPGSDVDNDKTISTTNEMHFSSVNSDQIYNCYQSVESPVNSVKASELNNYFNLVNENPPTLDFTLQSMTSGAFKYELVKND